MMKLFLLTMVSLTGLSSYCFGMSAISFDAYDMGNIKYDNRIRLSIDRDDYSFEATQSTDVNNDGKIDFLEKQTFIPNSDTFTILVGNASSRYGLHNALLWIGVDGNFEHFSLNETTIYSHNARAHSDPSIVWLYPELSNVIDKVILVDVQESIGKRASKNDPVSTSNPFPILFHNFLSNDPDARLYIGGYGAIRSGFNSQTPPTSDIVVAPSPTEQHAPVVPEPLSWIMISIGMFGIIRKQWRSTETL